MEASRISDMLEIEQRLARGAVGMTMDDVDTVIGVFTPDGTYSPRCCVPTSARPSPRVTSPKRVSTR